MPEIILSGIITYWQWNLVIVNCRESQCPGYCSSLYWADQCSWLA